MKDGIIVPLMPFLTEKAKYDFASVERQVDYQINSGISGIFVLTTCGQAASFSFEENRDLASVVTKATRSRVPVYIGIGRIKEEPDYTLKMLEHALSSGADAAVVSCTDLSPEEQVEHFKHLNEYGFPLIAYSLGNEQKQLQRLEEIISLDNVIGVKITQDVREHDGKEHFKKAVNSGKKVFIGEDACIFEGLELGAAGGVNAIANLIPSELSTSFTDYQQGNTNRTRLFFEKVNQILLSTLYYNDHYSNGRVDAASALQNAVHQRLGFGSPAMKKPRITYKNGDQEKIKDALKLFGLL